MSLLDSKAFAFLKTLLMMYQRQPKETVLRHVKTVQRDALPFFEHEIGQIFAQFDPQGLYEEVRAAVMYLTRGQDGAQSDEDLNNKMMQTVYLVKQLLAESKALSGQQVLAGEKLDELTGYLNELHTFTYKDYGGLGFVEDDDGELTQQNIVVRLLGTGDFELVDFIYSKASECNVKALLISENVQDM